MGLFDKVFSKKNCVICGKELGVFGKTKLGDESYLCKECSGKLSPHFHGYGRATGDDIREQLAYREQNAQVVAAFNVTTTIDGGQRKLYLDEDAGNLIITGSGNWRQANPDVIAFSQVAGSQSEVKEIKTELKREDGEGKKVPYDPPRYDIDYNVHAKVFVNHPWFSEISWQVNGSRIEEKDSAPYNDAVAKAQAVCDALDALHRQARADAAPRQAANCPNCGATTTPDAAGCCEYCGSRIA